MLRLPVQDIDRIRNGLVPLITRVLVDDESAIGTGEHQLLRAFRNPSRYIHGLRVNCQFPKKEFKRIRTHERILTFLGAAAHWYRNFREQSPV